MVYVDLTGQRFGTLTAIENIGYDRSSNHYMWKCRCDCGNEKIITSSNLMRGGNKTCGSSACKQTLDLNNRTRRNIEIGDKFGRLTVISYSHVETLVVKTGKNVGATATFHFWKCVCECGKEVTIRMNNLYSGKARSCGCLRKEVALKTVEKYLTGSNSHWYNDGRSAEKAKYCKKFTPAKRREIREIFEKICFLTGLTQEDNGRNLSVHHIDYNKSQGCAGMKWSLVPLSASAHGKVGGKKWYWFNLLRDYWCYKYLDGDFAPDPVFYGPYNKDLLWRVYQYV